MVPARGQFKMGVRPGDLKKTAVVTRVIVKPADLASTDTVPVERDDRSEAVSMARDPELHR